MKKIFLTFSIAFVALSSICLNGCEKEDPDAISMNDVNKGIIIITGKDGVEYEVVDLGFKGILFAKCNIGATSPEQTGLSFAWGETEAKKSFSWTNYRWNDGEQYFSPIKYFDEDNKGTLDTEDDAATMIMGEGWRIPKTSEFTKLLTKGNCTAKWCKLNGVGGYLFTSVVKGYEGNSIFLPLAGELDHDVTKFDGQFGWYWCNTIQKDPKTNDTIFSEARTLSLEHRELDNHTIESRPRFMGIPIRPIYTGK